MYSPDLLTTATTADACLLAVHWPNSTKTKPNHAASSLIRLISGPFLLLDNNRSALNLSCSFATSLLHQGLNSLSTTSDISPRWGHLIYHTILFYPQNYPKLEDRSGPWGAGRQLRSERPCNAGAFQGFLVNITAQTCQRLVAYHVKDQLNTGPPKLNVELSHQCLCILLGMLSLVIMLDLLYF